jgi:hypothetical protein
MEMVYTSNRTPLQKEIYLIRKCLGEIKFPRTERIQYFNEHSGYAPWKNHGTLKNSYITFFTPTDVYLRSWA